MKILLTGYSGFLGTILCNNFLGKFEVQKVNLRHLPEKQSSYFNEFLDKFTEADVIINCAANLKPKTKNDIFINEDFPIILLNHLKKKGRKPFFIHISSINVLIDERKDFYTITKKNAEKNLEKQNITIIRLPLVYEKNNNIIQPSGNFKQIDDYLKLNFLPIYPMIFPGHLHYPVEINKISNFIEKIINNKNRERTIYNIAGNEKKSLWDLFQEMANYRKRRVLKINFRILDKILPNIIKSFLIKNSSVIQQLIVIDHTEYKEKKEYL
jgi:nucleoside-diphosphate-sugar epimerase